MAILLYTTTPKHDKVTINNTYPLFDKIKLSTSNPWETSRSASCQRYALIKPLDFDSERKAYRELAMVKLKEGNVGATSEIFQTLKLENIEFVVTPYEANGQLAHMSQLGVENGGVAMVITEDSDLIAYGYLAEHSMTNFAGKLSNHFDHFSSSPSIDGSGTRKPGAFSIGEDNGDDGGFVGGGGAILVVAAMQRCPSSLSGPSATLLQIVCCCKHFLVSNIIV
ncbi:hypothetical protein JHK84_050028 [Glycine max]|nr:hypothetical protein JHK84_050028 [Glycine max]